MRYQRHLAIALAVGLVLVISVSGLVCAAEGNDIVLANEYISITVNGTSENTGRFSVNTTGGDPQRPDDDHKPLIYGQANPWTSFTTIRLDSNNYVFGGPTFKRAGQGVPTGQRLRGPEVVDDTIVTVYSFGKVQVTQVLGFARSLTTGLKDTARIEYVIENHDETPHRVGLRVVLDTMLGANDGAPFRVQEQAILSDTSFEGPAVPQFWQAFDSLTDPQVMSQGTLRGQGITPPDRIYFTNWGSVADDPWDFDFSPGRDFTRKGEFELDSAMALVWEPVTVAAGQSVRYVTHYGMGGITIAPGKLSLGVTAPTQVVARKDAPEIFPVIAYIENSGEGEALDAAAVISLPSGFELVDGPKVRRLGNIGVNSSAQVRWQVKAVNPNIGTAWIKVQVEAKNSESNRVQRAIKVVAPAKLNIEVWATEVSIDEATWAPGAFRVQARIRNGGGAPARAVTASFQAPIGIALAKGESERKFAGDIEPGQSQVVSWHLVPTGVTGNSIPYTIKAASADTKEVTVNGTVAIPPARAVVWWQWLTGEGSMTPGSMAIGQLQVANIGQFAGGEGVISFDPDVLQVVGGRLGVAKGTLMRFDSEGNSVSTDWGQLDVDNKQGQIRYRVELGSPWSSASGDWLEVGFRIVGTGESEIVISELSILSSSAEGISVRKKNSFKVK